MTRRPGFDDCISILIMHPDQFDKAVASVIPPTCGCGPVESTPLDSWYFPHGTVHITHAHDCPERQIEHVYFHGIIPELSDGREWN